jgi:hypothetical protein
MATWKKVVVESAADTITQDTTGNAGTATALETAVNIGGVSFDGTTSINLPGVNASGTQNTTGNAATATALQNARTIGGVSFNGTANINLPGVNTAGNQNTSGNAATATTLAAARDFSLTGDVTATAVSFNGGANVALSTSLAAESVGSAQLDLVDGNSPSNGYILSYVSSGSNGDFQWIANTASANDSTITLDAGAGLKTGGAFTVNQAGNETITFDIDLQNVQEAVFSPSADYVNFIDGGATGDTRKEQWSDIATAITGTNLASQNGVIKLAVNPDIEGTLAVTGNATFDSSVTVAGNLTVNGTTTTVNSTTVEVADKMLKLANVANPDTDTANGGGIQLESSSSSDEWPELKWNSSGNLAGWTVSDHTATSSTDFPIAIMEFGAAPPSSPAIETEGGAGSFFADTTNGNLYLYI